jgi:hypothetical protein
VRRIEARHTLCQRVTPRELMTHDITLHKLPAGLAWHDSGDLLMEGDSGDPSTLTLEPGAVFAMPRAGTIKVGAVDPVHVGRVHPR